MNKLKINLVGGGFQHTISSTGNIYPKYVDWDKTGSANISFHIDDAIRIPTDKTKKNYAWICELSTIIPWVLDWVPKNISYLEDNFELLFTHDRRLVGLSDKFKFVKVATMPWVHDIKIHDKNKLISMIASTKIYCEGHLYRQHILEKYKNQMDCFGVGRNQIEIKDIGLKDYYFSIAMENGVYTDMFTEKILDCFAMGTIPIYWGTPSIGEFFNENGIIKLTNDFKIEDLSIDLYHSKMEYIKENFELTKQLPIPEDYLYDNFLR